MSTKEKYEKKLNELIAKREKELAATARRKETAAEEIKKAAEELDAAVIADDATAYKTAKARKAEAEADLELSTAKEKRLNSKPYISEELANEYYEEIREDIAKDKLAALKSIKAIMEEWHNVTTEFEANMNRNNKSIRKLDTDIMRSGLTGNSGNRQQEQFSIVHFFRLAGSYENAMQSINEQITKFEK